MTTHALDIEGVLDAISFTKGVIGVVVCTRSGVPIRDTFKGDDRSQAATYAQMGSALVADATAACAATANGAVVSLRVRSRHVEVFVRCDAKYLLVVVQDTNS